MTERVTKAECDLKHENIETNLNHITEKVDKLDGALFGNDGRGGMAREMTEVHNSVSRIEESINGSTQFTKKKTVAYITGTLAIVGPIIIVIIQAAFKRIGWL